MLFNLMSVLSLSQPEALRQLIQLYIGRSFVCWKNPEVVQWLERNVRTVLERVNSADPVVEDSAVKWVTAEFSFSRVSLH